MGVLAKRSITVGELYVPSRPLRASKRPMEEKKIRKKNSSRTYFAVLKIPIILPGSPKKLYNIQLYNQGKRLFLQETPSSIEKAYTV